ncbi:MAG TPA: hypothetical protein VFF79_06130 [Conexibacter sp.]|nr:hypothetical protein [Conexibacter sp.]
MTGRRGREPRAVAAARKGLGLAAVLLLAASAAGGWPAAAAPLPPQIHTVAGGGGCAGAETSGGPCDNVPATSVPIGHARAVAALPGGGFLYLDRVNDLVREVSPSGVVTTVAGNGSTTDAPDGALAVSSGLNGPVAIAPLSDGGFLITEYDGSVVRKVSSGTPATARITTIAGTGAPGYNGPTGQATLIELNYPTDAQPTADGRVLIADAGNEVIRIVSAPWPGVRMDTIAGGGPCDDANASCDGTAAGGVALDDPVSVSPIQGGSGGYLIAEYADSAVRRVSQTSPAGTFSTVAGTPGQAGFAGDGGPATSARLDHPRQVVATPDGGFLIADTDNQRVRLVSPSGTIATVAGDGVSSSGGDGGPASAAPLQAPAGASPTPDGGFLIADEDNNAVRAVTIPPTTTIALSPATPNGRNGWYVSAVHATASATNAVATSCALDPVAPPPVFDLLPPSCPYAGAGADIAGDGSHTAYAASVDAAGDKELPVSVSLKVDRTPPTVRCGGSPSFRFGAGGGLTATVADGTSGPAPALVSVPARTTRLGHHSVTLTGADNAGNAATVQCRYTVLPATLRPIPTMAWRFSPGHGYGTVRQLVVRRVPAGAAVAVTCRGTGCPFSALRGVRAIACHGTRCRRTKPRHAGAYAVDLTPLFAHRRLAVGARLTVSVTRPGTIGRVTLLTVRAGADASHRVACLAPGSSVPGKGC